MNNDQINNEYQTSWNLGLLYQSPDDPQIEKDLEIHNKKRREFAQKYKNRTDYLKEEAALLQALKEYEQLLNDLQGARPLIYFYYLTAIESHNEQAQASLNRITTELTKASNQLTFFPIKLGKIDEAYQQKFLASQKLTKYHYLLKKRFKLAEFDLSEKEEKIINLADQTSYDMWVQGVEKLLSNITIKFNNGDLPIVAASSKLAELPNKKRQKLHQKILKLSQDASQFAESEINAIVKYKQIKDELRGFKKPYQSTILHYENDQKTIVDLASLITTNFDLAHRFFKLKAKLFKKEKLTYADRAAKLRGIKTKYPFEKTYNLVYQIFADLDPEFAHILEYMAQKGQLDIFPKKNKEGLAFCSSSNNNPTFVLLNHTDDFDSVTTLAHEMGHAIHSELSKKQPVIYENYSLSIGETASTFFEQFVFEKMIEGFNKKQKMIALHNQIQEDISTIFRQIALFNFETELHENIKSNGFLTSKQIGELLNRHMSAYLGSSFELTEQDGSFYILWPHIRRFFYTYTYAYGQLISKAMINKTKEDQKFILKIKEFLSAGGSDAPSNILKNIGIDITQEKFFKAGLTEIEQKIESLEKMIA
ncbi:MAG: M3 family metallopeptidase [Patescibacteria group bacterium]|nr:M3 family metallopeptidase [Patescibacteria group bacterium]